MANNSATQQALADDPTFRRRVKDAFSQVAWEVINESDDVPHHLQREEYARRTVLLNLDAVTTQTAPWLVNRTNLIAFETSYSFEGRAVITAAGDPDIRAQLLADWDIMAGVEEIVTINP